MASITATRIVGPSGQTLNRVAFLGLSAAMAAWTLVFYSSGSASDSVTAYWTFHVAPGMYAAPAYSFASHEYPPIVAQLLAPLTALPFEWFRVVWLAGQLALLLYLVGPRWLGVGLLLPPVQWVVWNGNAQNFYALVAALGLRYPALWAIPLLTKVTPGVGVLWFAVRREWRNAAIACGATAALVVVSVVTVPAMWGEWLGFLLRPSNAAPTWMASLVVPLWLRLPASVALVIWGARTNRPWVLAVTLWLAMPTAWWLGLYALLGRAPTRALATPASCLRLGRYAHPQVRPNAVHSPT